jgi:hypothetical protein
LTTYTYLLKDKIECGCCGRNYFAKYKPVVNGDKVYICSSRLAKGGGCGQNGVNISLIESAIFDQMTKSDMLAKYVSKEKEIVETLRSEVEKLTETMKFNDLALAAREAESKRLLKAYVSQSLEITDAQFNEMNKEIDSSIKQLTDKIERAKILHSEKTRAITKYELLLAMPLELLLDRNSVRTSMRYMVISNNVDPRHSEIIGQLKEYVKWNQWQPIRHRLLVEPTQSCESLTA